MNDKLKTADEMFRALGYIQKRECECGVIYQNDDKCTTMKKIVIDRNFYCTKHCRWKSDPYPLDKQTFCKGEILACAKYIKENSEREAER